MRSFAHDLIVSMPTRSNVIDAVIDMGAIPFAILPLLIVFT